MPVYDYECVECGVFTALRPMSQCREPFHCPSCGQDAPRVFVTAPALANMDAGRRKAYSINERAAHEPKVSSAGDHRHGAGCSCCRPNAKSGAAQNGGKTFPKRRPWMISH
jgi:putative FmdB family regulatory protein